MPDCRNDCVTPPLFPKTLNNRPGLARIDYRIGAYADIREALFRALDRSPALPGWSYRAADDPGIALLESSAIVGDILTFYQDVYANEAFLSTAQWRESISDLVRLTGYRLTPGVGGRATFAFEVKGDKPVVVPAGFPVKADVEGLPNPSDFEIASPLTAVPGLSRFALYRPFENATIQDGTAQFAVDTAGLAAAGLKLQPNDRLMLVAPGGGTNPTRQIAVVDSVSTRFEKTEIAIKGSWRGGIVSGLTAYKLGRSFRWFGHNAPAQTTTISGGTATQTATDYTAVVYDTFIGWVLGGGFSYNPLPDNQCFPLDMQVDDLSAGATMLVSMAIFDLFESSGEYFFERTILSTSKATLTLGSLTGPSTVVRLNSGVPLSGFPLMLLTDVRTPEFHEVIGKKFALTGVRTASAGGDTSHLFFFGDGDTYQLLNGRRVQLVRPDPANPGRNTVDEATVTIEASAVTPREKATLRPVQLAPAPAKFTLADFPLQNGAVTVFGNLAEATQGKTERTTILGNGDSRQAFQTFRLPKAPLTYLLSNSATPPQVPQVQITVDGRIWTQVASLFGQSPDAEVHIVREDSAGDSWVQFGDGITGARLPSGVDNVVAVIRTGVAAYGFLKPEAKPQAGTRLERLDKIQLAGEATGGAPAETGANAREAAPGKIQSLGRLVSLRDFESEAIAIPGVTKASAAWDLVYNVPTLLITILMQSGRDAELEQVRQTLANYNVCRGPQRFPIQVKHGRLEWVYVDAVFAVAPSFQQEAVLAAVRQALTGPAGLFALPMRRFGENEFKMRIEGAMQNVEGVAWAEVTAFGPAGLADDPSKLVLPAEPKPLDQTVYCSSSHVLALWDSHLQLTVAAAPAKGVCA